MPSERGMRMLSRTRGVTVVMAAAATAAFLWVMAGAWTASPSVADERPLGVAGADAAADRPALPAASAQGGDSGVEQDGDERLPVQLWTLVAAGGAAGLGLLLFLLRLAVGWVKPPPPQEESQH